MLFIYYTAASAARTIPINCKFCKSIIFKLRSVQESEQYILASAYSVSVLLPIICELLIYSTYAAQRLGRYNFQRHFIYTCQINHGLYYYISVIMRVLCERGSVQYKCAVNWTIIIILPRGMKNRLEIWKKYNNCLFLSRSYITPFGECFLKSWRRVRH